jgi:serine/threonine protein kinase
MAQLGHDGERMINQYILKEEIGRGSFAIVHHAVDAITMEDFVIFNYFPTLPCRLWKLKLAKTRRSRSILGGG